MSRNCQRFKKEAAKWEEAAESGFPCEKVASRCSGGGGRDHITDRGGAKMTGPRASKRSRRRWKLGLHPFGELKLRKWGSGVGRRPCDVRRDAGGRIIRLVLKDLAFKSDKDCQAGAGARCSRGTVFFLDALFSCLSAEMGSYRVRPRTNLMNTVPFEMKNVS